MLTNDISSIVETLGADGTLFELRSVINILRSHRGVTPTAAFTKSFIDGLVRDGVLDMKCMHGLTFYCIGGPKYYSQSKGEWLLIRDMNTKHIANAIKSLDNFKQSGRTNPVFISLVDELASRAHLVEPAT